MIYPRKVINCDAKIHYRQHNEYVTVKYLSTNDHLSSSDKHIQTVNVKYFSAND
jgi:hypothetical protein